MADRDILGQVTITWTFTPRETRTLIWAALERYAEHIGCGIGMLGNIWCYDTKQSDLLEQRWKDLLLRGLTEMG